MTASGRSRKERDGVSTGTACRKGVENEEALWNSEEINLIGSGISHSHFESSTMLHLDDVHGHVSGIERTGQMLESLSMRRLGQQGLAEELRDCHFEAIYLTKMKLQSDHPHILSNVVHDKNRVIVFWRGFPPVFWWCYHEAHVIIISEWDGGVYHVIITLRSLN